jgi:Putative zinc-finger
MTCQEIYERIWTDALRECSPAVRNAIDSHASQCPRCRSALRIVDDLTLALNRLEEPEPERELCAAIMARVARLPSTRASSAGAEESRATSSRVMSWVWILAGVAIVAAERTTAMIVSAWPWSLTTPRLGGAGFGPAGAGGSALWLAAGLLMFLIGLLRHQHRTLDGRS